MLVVVLGIALVPGSAAGSGPRWTPTWTASPHAPTGLLGPSWGPEGFDDQTVRQVVRISEGGSAMRIRLSNAYGSAPLVVTGATVARAGEGAAVRPGTVRHVTFRGHRSVTVPVGGEVVGDLARLPVAPLSRVTVTLYLAGRTGPATGHVLGATSWRASGEHRADVAAGAFTEASQSWFYLDAVEVVDVAPRRDVVVAFGDSITDGAFSTPDADNRYPDELAERFGGRRAVVNAGIGGNRVLDDSPCFGEKATSRFERDALSWSGVRTVIVLLGVNDIGMSRFPFVCAPPIPVVTAGALIDGYRELIGRARARGVRVVGGTVLPFKGSIIHDESGEAVRDEVNAWIRTSGEFDAVVDFERAVVDPADPDALRPAFDSGDHLHPNDAGYRVMAEAVDLSVL
ncbi:MAG: SGNH/GDSL hydrolase family protein [Saccharothrix sp.]|nr:SGNH/GDSL hydrolase family protein [Saccharothrix sp.]